MLAILSLAFLAFILGIKHSYDADHLLAVSTFLKKSPTIKNSTRLSISWAVGHMLTATIITILLFIFRESILNTILSHFEKIVGIMLILLGLWSLKGLFGFHSHKHSHDGITHRHPHLHFIKNIKETNSEEHKTDHSHKHMFGIGMIHGLASNDELLILFTASLGVTSLGGIIVGIGIFSIGVVLGMILFSMIFTYPLLKAKSKLIHLFITWLVGSGSLIYGVMSLVGVV